jgi:hypothetical protein
MKQACHDTPQGRDFTVVGERLSQNLYVVAGLILIGRDKKEWHTKNHFT